MNLRVIKIALLIYILAQVVTMAVLMIGEIQLVMSGIEYRFQYLLILFFIIPILIFGGIIEYYGFKKLMKKNSILMLVPFFVAISLLVAMSSEGKSDPITLSYFVSTIEFIGLLVFSYSFLKVMRPSIKTDNIE
jgi:hypothetical protein